MRVKFLCVLGVTGVAVVLAALLLIPLALRIFSHIYNTPERQVARMDRYVRNFADYVAREQLSSTDSTEIARYTRRHRLMYVTVFTDHTAPNTDGERPATGETNASPATDAPQDGGGSWGGGNSSTAYEPFFDRLFPDADPDDGTLYIVRFANGNHSVAVMDDSYPILCDLIVFCGVGVAMLVFGLIILIYYHSQTRAIVTLAREVEAVSSGASDSVITSDRNDELGMLARDVDIMRRTIEEKMAEQERAWQANRDLLTSMTHDLRTPLTTLLGYMELLGTERDANQNMTDEQRAYLRVCTGKAEQIKALSDKLFLYFWAYNRPDGEFSSEPYDAGLLFGQLFGDYIPAMAVAGLTVEIDLSAIPAGGSVRIDPDCLRRVTDNLFDNLTKYADPTEPVRITAAVQTTPTDTRLLLRMENAVAATATESAGTRIGHKTCRNMMTSLRGDFRTETTDGIFAAVLEFTLCLDHPPVEGA